MLAEPYAEPVVAESIERLDEGAASAVAVAEPESIEPAAVQPEPEIVAVETAEPIQVEPIQVEPKPALAERSGCPNPNPSLSPRR